MHILGGQPRGVGDQIDRQRPVITDGWAEAIVELQRDQSRRRHPSSCESGNWEKDGGFGPSEWAS